MNWNPDETLFRVGDFQIRYYSLLFILGFIFTYHILKRFFTLEKKPIETLDVLIYQYGILGTLIGARLGHVIFYDWDYFSHHLLEIFLPFKFSPSFKFTGFAGLASHGAAIGILLCIYLFCKKRQSFRWIWIVDRGVIPITLASVFIRMGNFMNSEIKGKIVDKAFPLGVRFIKGGDISYYDAVQKTGTKTPQIAFNEIANNPQFANILESIPFRHPVQLYESFFYLVTFIALWLIYHKTNKRNQSGFIFGAFLILVWTIRFFAEFFKESQGGFESLLGVLSTGQWLSIPFVLFGFYLLLNRHNIFEVKKR